MKKKTSPPYLPPRLVKAAQGWYIVWYETNPATGELQRFRNTFSLNRIESKAQRATRAKAIINEIDISLNAGGYIFAGSLNAGLGVTPLREAMKIARQLKTQSKSQSTNDSYSSLISIFSTWLKSERLEALPAKAFTRFHAIRFLDHARLKRRVGGRTYNNNITLLRSIWNSLLERGYVEVNPWMQVRKVKPEAKERRTFSKKEAAAVASYTARENPGLFAAILLQYYCFIRPNEIRQLRRRDIDLEAGRLAIPAEISKTNKPRLVTLPEKVRQFLSDRFGNVQESWYLFGPGMAPHSRRAQGQDEFYKAHKAVLRHLVTAKTLGDTKGLTFYSWKDTGLTVHSQEIGLLDLMQQAGHHDPKMTMVYIHQGKDNPAFRRLEGPLIGE
ncbi:MAG: tyrosine-type recombinase/integrase [Saprospiraceae bacterium]